MEQKKKITLRKINIMTKFNIKRIDGETEDNYKYRICDNKKLLGVTWEGVAEIINEELGLSHGESAYRKWFKAYSQGRESVVEETASTEELDKLTTKKLEIQKERVKLSAEKTEINKWVREQGRTELIYDKVVEAIGNLEPLKVRELKIDTSKGEKHLLVDLADSHYGRKGTIEGLEGEVLADYSVEIFEERMWALRDKIVALCIKEDINNITVLNLGDSVDGMLRMSQLQFIQLGMADQTMGYAEFMSHWLDELSSHSVIGSIEYRTVLGNHSESRPLNSQRGDFKNENMERITTWFIKERLKNNAKVNVHEAKSLTYFSIFNTNILATHGQEERNLENSIKDYTNIYNKKIHILKTGHLHHLSNKTIGMDSGQNIEYIQSPAICGIDEYSMTLKKVSNAGTLITVFEEGYGKLNTYDIRL